MDHKRVGFAGALKRAFEKHDKANQDYPMAEFNIVDRGVNKAPSQEAYQRAMERDRPKNHERKS